MRQYRGKTKVCCVYGDLFHQNDKCYIYPQGSRPDLHVRKWSEEVVPSSVGQSTGLKDKNGKEIYEGDVVAFDEKEWGSPENKLEVMWNDKNGCWDAGGGTNAECSEWKTVIGNIYENPELLK